MLLRFWGDKVNSLSSDKLRATSDEFCALGTCS